MIKDDLLGLPGPRRLAIEEELCWVPLKGILPRMMRELGSDIETASAILSIGLPAGTIAHRARPDTEDVPFFAVVSPRGAELAKRSGFSYETHINWRTGSIVRNPAAVVPMEVFWPDVQRAAADRNSARAPTTYSKPTQLEVDNWMVNYYQEASMQNKPPPKQQHEAFPQCQKETAATETQMREAIKRVPDNLKRSRGARDR